MKTAGLLYGEDVHYLDHLAPLCALVGVPLIVTDPKVAKLAERFYPGVELVSWGTLEALDKLVQEYDKVIVSTPRVLFDEVFFFAQQLQKKRVKTVWCPHGNSDKGRHSVYMEALQEEEVLLTYGPRIEAFLREKGVGGEFVRVGDYRRAYFEKHRVFYEGCTPKFERPSVLYAPTWQDREESSSFPHVWEQLEALGEVCSLRVKLHPNLYHQFPEEIQWLRERISLVEDFPPIYPLLAQTDLLIGDQSSIGYDFLMFGKPMIHFGENDLPGVHLGMNEKDCLVDGVKKLLGSSLETEKPYRETFSDVKPLDNALSPV